MIGWTLGSALGWGLLFLVVSGGRAMMAGADMGRVAAPILAFAVIGFTVGGLVGPLVRGLWFRVRAR